MYTKELQVMYTKYLQYLNYFVYITDMMDAYHCIQNKNSFYTTDFICIQVMSTSLKLFINILIMHIIMYITNII